MLPRPPRPMPLVHFPQHRKRNRSSHHQNHQKTNRSREAHTRSPW